MRIRLFSSLSTKLIVALTTIVLIYGAIFFFYLYQEETAKDLAETEVSVRNLDSLLSTSATHFMEDNQTKELQTLVVALMPLQPITHISVVDRESRVIADSIPSHIGHIENEIMFKKALKSGEQKSIQYLRQQKDFLGSYVPVLRNPGGIARPDNIIGVAFMEVDNSKIKDQSSARIRRMFFILGLTIVCLAAAAFFVMRVLVISPVLRLKSASVAYAKGNYSTQLDLNKKDELGDLARAFDGMAKKTNKNLNEMKKSQHQLQNIIDNIPAAISLKDLKGRYLLVNKQFLRIHRLSQEQVTGQTDYAIFPKERADDLLQDDRKVIEGELTVTGEEARPNSSGVVHTYISTKLVLCDTDKMPYALLSVGIDITKQKKREQLLEETKVESERGARIMRSLLEDLDRSKQELAERAKELARSNAELEQFAYVTSHDLREPLRMVASYVQLLQQRYEGKLDEDADEFIYYAVDGVNRMQTLIKDILAYSRVGTHRVPFELTDCNLALRGALNNLKVLIEESKARIVSEHLPEIAVDSAQLTQLFQNLIANAIKFRQPDKLLDIEISSKRLENKEWLFGVKDNGIGFEQQYAEKIFIIFQRLHGRADYLGTGIGLAISKKIVERHGGRIWAESKPGKGSIFYFTIPATSLIVHGAKKHDQRG